MAGVSALSLSRGWLASATSSNDAIDQNASQTEVLASGRDDSCYALQICWPTEGVRPNLTDLWWRRLDSFCLDSFSLGYDDSQLIELWEERRAECRHADRLERTCELADAARDGGGIVELILSADGPRANVCVPERSNNLLIDMIHIQRSRW
jgi:hypothetical protein